MWRITWGDLYKWFYENWLWSEILYVEKTCFLQRGKTKKQKNERAKQQKEDANLFPQALLFVSCALVVDFAQSLIDFLLLCRAPAKEHIIYKGIFKQGQEHKHKTAHEVDVDGFHVRNLWEGLPKVSVNCGHGKHRCHTLGQTNKNKSLLDTEFMALVVFVCLFHIFVWLFISSLKYFPLSYKWLINTGFNSLVWKLISFTFSQR